MIDVVTCRGIGESIDGPTLCGQIVKRLDPARFREVPLTFDVDYGPVGVGPDVAFNTSLQKGETALVEAIDATENDAVILGFSGGAALSGNVAANYADGRYPNISVLGVGLVADPMQPRGVCPGHYGVAGSRPVEGIPAQWAYDVRDPIPCTPVLSPLRTIADQSAAMSLADPVAWGRDLIDRLARGRWQPSAIDWRDPIGTIRRYNKAIEQAKAYTSGLHYSAYVGWQSDVMADWISRTF